MQSLTYSRKRKQKTFHAFQLAHRQLLTVTLREHCSQNAQITRTHSCSLNSQVSKFQGDFFTILHKHSQMERNPYNIQYPYRLSDYLFRHLKHKTSSTKLGICSIINFAVAYTNIQAAPLSTLLLHKVKSHHKISIRKPKFRS